VTVAGIRQGTDGRAIAVVTPQGDVAAGAIVLAAGVWSNEIARTAGIELPVQPRKGHILVTARVPGLITHPLLEGSYSASVHTAAEALQVALVAEMTAGGTMLLGSSREFAGFDRSVSVPALAHMSAIRSYAGLRPWSPDHLPLVGPVAAVPGLYLATGHEGAGIGLAPVTGHILSEMLIDGQMPDYATAVRPDRFTN
jgi:glycine/D-amino acid oxidase-like deaminating enzyme